MVQIHNQSFTFIFALIVITILITRFTEHITGFPASVSENTWIVLLADFSFFLLIFLITAVAMDRLKIFQKSE
ncbi:hypothetical protein DYD21_12055 [Rhodohalobacter sp. SW132]|uniref:hypothetical protein n=1 Tax=Rhodohalobacter sp. SW132 TaxID=2293433 RepID=UPI000E21C793|nr:hypothetical protein [Rhodohalobacter sp. SW132]REL33495.1 hypothetical protein DYD21_12055 [Rhodohalobacter sp. SW132]